jgi:4-diphosphocytidyl-2-C-methyl-D-erythritol kinase
VLATRIAGEAGSGRTPLDYQELLVNDLEHAALSLRPEIREALDALRDAGAAATLLTGSGPTAFGLFPDLAAADRAASMLPPRWVGAIVAAPHTFI